MDTHRVERLAHCTDACAGEMRLRILTTLTRHGVGRQVTLGDLAILLADADLPAPAPGGELQIQVRYLEKIDVLGYEEAVPAAPKAVCWLLDGAILGDLAELSARLLEEIGGGSGAGRPGHVAGG